MFIGNCKDCQFFDRMPERVGKAHADNGGVGNCIIDPPQPEKDKQGRRSVAVFPMVLGRMGCAQFDRKGASA